MVISALVISTDRLKHTWRDHVDRLEKIGNMENLEIIKVAPRSDKVGRVFKFMAVERESDGI